MALDIDQVLEQIGSMGRYQIRLLCVLSYLGFFVTGFQTMLMTFITTEPGWRCVTNSSLCNATGVFRPGEDGYNFRCEKKLPRSEWEYEDIYTSSVTEAEVLCASLSGYGVCRRTAPPLCGNHLFLFVGVFSHDDTTVCLLHSRLEDADHCTVGSGLAIGFAWWLLPESPRWLLVKGKVDKARKILEDVARFNRKEMPQQPLLAPSSPEDGGNTSGGFRDLFATLKMSRTTLVCWFGWFMNSMVYYGVRSKENCYRSMILAALASMGAVLLTKNNDDKGFLAGRIIMALLSKFFITVSFDAIYVFSAELFPTVVRNTGMGTSSGVGRLGSFSSSYIIWLARVHPVLPYGIMGIGAFVAAVLCISLPETKDQPTAEVVRNDTGNDVVIANEGKEDEEKTEFTSRLKVFESVVNQKVLSEDGLPGAVCDTCKYRIERAWRMSNQDQSDLQQLRSNAADTAQTLRFKRGHPVSPAFTCTSKGDENVTVVRKKKDQRLVFDPSPLEPCQIQPPLSADQLPSGAMPTTLIQQ
ncbi:hypothetical protein OS493_016190 [Desmophyllum pertusum]|uniref:Uncharacterized protein n=1 Tax=Desmophyllum pertusum TaxID=174260 RepID=A0A9X0A308_9CNID|nr:hypothetical protein OS493_016190 [Desmophyllum pertusum]